MEVVRQIGDCGTTSGEPTKRVQIAECGQIRDESEKEASDRDDEAEEEEEEEEDEEKLRGPKRPRVRFAKSAASPKESEGGDGARRVDAGAGNNAVSEESRPGDRVGGATG